jgi:hypothetical protein
MLLIPIITLLTFCLKNIIRLLKVAIHIPTDHFFFFVDEVLFRYSECN